MGTRLQCSEDEFAHIDRKRNAVTRCATASVPLKEALPDGKRVGGFGPPFGRQPQLCDIPKSVLRDRKAHCFHVSYLLFEFARRSCKRRSAL
jgi:hypothetical protein